MMATPGFDPFTAPLPDNHELRTSRSSMSLLAIYLPDPRQITPDTSLPWLRLRAGVAEPEQGQSRLSDVALLVRPRERVVGIVPGERVTLHRVRIPARSRAAQLQALPFALEEHLSEDLEAVHIAPGSRLAGGEWLAAVVSHRDMQAWQAALDLPWMAWIPETLLVPPNPTGDAIRVQIQGHRVLLQVPDSEAVVLPLDGLGWWLERLAGKPPPGDIVPAALESTAEPRPVLHWQGPAELIPPAVAARWAVSVDDASPRGLEALAPALLRPPPLNLLTGPYSQAGFEPELWRRWRWPAALAAGVAGVWLVALALEVAQLQTEVRRVDVSIEQIFTQALPDEPLIDPVRQFQQRLQAAGGQGGQAGLVAQRLGQAVPVLQRTRGEVQQLRVEEGRLEIEIELPDIATLDRLRQDLTGTQAQVRILSAESGESGVRARLLLEGRG